MVLLFAIVQVPAVLVTLPVIAYVFATEATTPAIIFSIWTLIAGLSDNLLKPLMLGRGLEVPMPVILIGVIGGMVADGLLGLFVGPVLLAVGYVLLMEWLRYDPVEGSPRPTIRYHDGVGLIHVIRLSDEAAFMRERDKCAYPRHPGKRPGHISQGATAPGPVLIGNAGAKRRVWARLRRIGGRIGLGPTDIAPLRQEQEAARRSPRMRWVGRIDHHWVILFGSCPSRHCRSCARAIECDRTGDLD